MKFTPHPCTHPPSLHPTLAPTHQVINPPLHPPLHPPTKFTTHPCIHPPSLHPTLCTQQEACYLHPPTHQVYNPPPNPPTKLTPPPLPQSNQPSGSSKYGQREREGGGGSIHLSQLLATPFISAPMQQKPNYPSHPPALLSTLDKSGVLVRNPPLGGGNGFLTLHRSLSISAQRNGLVKGLVKAG